MSCYICGQINNLYNCNQLSTIRKPLQKDEEICGNCLIDKKIFRKCGICDHKSIPDTVMWTECQGCLVKVCRGCRITNGSTCDECGDFYCLTCKNSNTYEGFDRNRQYNEICKGCIYDSQMRPKSCEYLHISGVNEIVDESLEKDNVIDRLHFQIEELKMEIAHLRAFPGGPDYQEAMKRFYEGYKNE